MKEYFFAVLAILALVPVISAAEPHDGQSIFEARCGLCHQLPDAGMLRPEQWRRLLDTKQKLMEKAGMPPLTDGEYKAVFDFLVQSGKHADNH